MSDGLWPLVTCYSECMAGLLADEYTLLPCRPHLTGSGDIWKPTEACDGLIVASFYPSHQHLARFDILEAVSPRTGKLRPVPAICFGLAEVEYSGMEIGPLITIAVQHDLYQFERLLGLLPEQTVKHVREFFSEKMKPDSS